MSITIYKSDASPPSRAVLMVADILDINYGAIEINCATKENLTPQFTKKNPLHTVPVLEDGDFTLVDSHAIITYLVSKYGGDKHRNLYPTNFELRATIDQRLYFDATTIFPVAKTIIVAILHEKATETTEKQIEEVEEGYRILEGYLEDTEYVASDHLTLADVSIISTISTLEGIVPVNNKYKKVHAWLNKLKDEDWYKEKNMPGLDHLFALLKDGLKRNNA